MRFERTVMRISSTLFATIALLGMTACPADDDPGFDDWCGGHLCRWNLVDGQIAKAPTWHERDLGVEMVGPHVTLKQQPNISSVSCLELKVIADIEPAASVYIELDFRADGTTDYRERIPSARWQPLTLLVKAPSWYDAVELTIRKESGGKAVLARLEFGDGQGCTGAAIPLDDRPAGAWCETAEQCISAMCAPSKVCSQSFAACDEATECAAGTGPCVDWPATCR